MKMTKFFTIIFLFLLPLHSIGQELLTEDRVREMQKSGKYYFSVGYGFNEEEATKSAIRELTTRIIVGMVQQTIKSDKVEMQNMVEMQAQSATLGQTQDGRVRVFTWIEKGIFSAEQDHPSPASAPTPAPTHAHAPAQTSTPAPTPAPAPTPELASDPTPVPVPVSIPSSPSSPSTISNPIARELATTQTFADFRRMADGFRRQGKLVYGTNKASFVNPDDCHVAVFSSDQRLIALVEAGRDLLSGNTIQNVEQHFAENRLFWIHINN